MTLAQKRKAIVEECLERVYDKYAIVYMGEGSGIPDRIILQDKNGNQVLGSYYLPDEVKDYITQAINEYTEEVKKMVKSKMIHPTPELEGADNEAIYEYNEPYQLLLEELSK